VTIKLGATYPTLDLGTDPAVLRDWAVGVESIGFDEIFIPEHVVGIDTRLRPQWEPLNPTTLQTGKPIYDHTSPFFEPFVAMGFLAAVTTRITLTSGILVVPQRQTALIAKQAAVADVLSAGRIRLGIGVGWNDGEYSALGADFHVRGIRMDEQIEVLRRLWTEESVTFSGRFDRLDAAGVCPMPVQRPIPLIIGGDSGPAMERAVRRGDGWFLTRTATESVARTRLFWQRADELGRRAQLCLIGTVSQGRRAGAALLDEVAAWSHLGATHVNIRTATSPAPWPDAPGRKAAVDDHLEPLRAVHDGWLAR
jgi:probable F420-dependent oxidoreductase